LFHVSDFGDAARARFLSGRFIFLRNASLIRDVNFAARCGRGFAEVNNRGRFEGERPRDADLSRCKIFLIGAPF
jgi:hypothetical protein